VGSLLDKVTEFLTREGLEYRRMRDVDAVEMGVAGDNGNYRVVIVSDQDRPVMRFLTFVEGRVPATRRREAMEFITRANYGLLVGNFEFDLDDGEVRFKAAGDYEDGDMSQSQFRNLLFLSVSMVDRYFPGLQSVIQGSSDAAAAIAEIEQ